jgi:proteasome lid subunit RPN8/RPN11
LDESFFDKHGIDRTIARTRPYERWEPDARDPVKKAYESLQLAGQRRYLMQIAKKAGGWVINRHPYPGIGDSILAEIRPDVPLETGPPTWHVHPDKRTMIDPATGERWINPATDFPLARKDIHSAKELRKHIDKPVKKGGHGGQNVQGIHSHPDEGKYLFAPGPKKWIEPVHDHDEVFEESYVGHRARWRHIMAEHDGKDVAGPHSHPKEVKDLSTPLARRLDIHPNACSRLKSAERVFYVIEGCIKSDAVLTAGEAVFSVPSVTLWRSA